MGRFVKSVLVLLSLIGVAAGLMSPAAQAKTKVSATVVAKASGTRIVVKFAGAKPKKAKLVSGKKRYKLTRIGKKWRTKKLSSKSVAALTGKKVKIKATIGNKTRTLKTRVVGGTTPPPTSPPAPAPQALFPAPGVDQIGNPAWEAIKGYFLDSTFTSCPSAWPNCFSEERYGHFANLTQVYCRLTSAPGADITNYPRPMEILGAEQKADGSWGVSYYYEYGGAHIVTWYVQTDGSVTGREWYRTDPRYDPPTYEYSGLVWIRGAKDCSY